MIKNTIDKYLIISSKAGTQVETQVTIKTI